MQKGDHIKTKHINNLLMKEKSNMCGIFVPNKYTQITQIVFDHQTL